MSDIWVFGYGSLLWQPGFEYVESRMAVLPGRRRSLCVYSVVHRGTLSVPGLVFGLDRGGACLGMAFRVDARNVPEVVHYLREREQVTGVYQERWYTVWLDEARHRHVRALCYVADPNHSQYAGGLGLERQATIVRFARGGAGPNVDYVLNTARRLRELAINDRYLDRLTGLIGRRPSQSLRGQVQRQGVWAHRLERTKYRPPRIKLPCHGQLTVHHRRNVGF